MSPSQQTIQCDSINYLSMIDRGLIQICIKLFKELFTTLNEVMKQDFVISVLKGNFKGQTLTAIIFIYYSIYYTLL